MRKFVDIFTVMMRPEEQLIRLRETIPAGVELIAVSKTYPAETVRRVYDAGQRAFGENRPQEMCAKHDALPDDIRWHMIGHLQTNKVKYIAPFVAMIHSVDSDRLLAVIDREAAKYGRTIDVLFEVHVAREESKSGWDIDELRRYVADGGADRYGNIRVRGLMAIATQTDDTELIRSEFETVHALFGELRGSFGEHFDTLSMGMTHDYRIAIECGATTVRIGSLIFGARQTPAPAAKDTNE